MKYENEEQIRKDFARLFGWHEQQSEYGYSSTKKTLRTPEWAEIFSQVGKLLQLEDTAGNEPVLHAMCNDLSDIQNTLKQITENK